MSRPAAASVSIRRDETASFTVLPFPSLPPCRERDSPAPLPSLRPPSPPSNRRVHRETAINSLRRVRPIASIGVQRLNLWAWLSYHLYGRARVGVASLVVFWCVFVEIFVVCFAWHRHGGQPREGEASFVDSESRGARSRWQQCCRFPVAGEHTHTHTHTHIQHTHTHTHIQHTHTHLVCRFWDVRWTQ